MGVTEEALPDVDTEDDRQEVLGGSSGWSRQENPTVLYCIVM